MFTRTQVKAPSTARGRATLGPPPAREVDESRNRSALHEEDETRADRQADDGQESDDGDAGEDHGPVQRRAPRRTRQGMGIRLGTMPAPRNGAERLQGLEALEDE